LRELVPRAARVAALLNYHEEKLGRADDLQEADDATILDFSQAQRVARSWWMNQQRLAAGLPAGHDGPLTVKRATADYLDDYRRRGAKTPR
jgi:hypothetical protein